MDEVTTSQPRVLLAIDCDHTIIDGNSDTWVMALLPDHKVPGEIKNRFKTDHKSWTIYMGEIFQYMHSVGIKEDTIRQFISEIPLSPGIKELLEYQQSNKQIDCIIVSDSNSYFIDVILQTRNLQDGIKHVFTNQAGFEDGCLRIHFSNPHNCQRGCPANLCKQASLRAFIEERKTRGVVYDRICMIGDGHNDLCPCFILGEKDFVFPRRGYTLKKLLKELMERKSNADGCERIKANVVPWTSATEILDVVKDLVES